MKGLVFRIGGEGGEGVISTGELLTLACARAGYDIYAYKTYPAEIKGGYAMWQVRVKDELLLSQGDKVDVLICFNQEAYDRDIRDIAEDGVLLYDPEQCPNIKEDAKYQKHGIPFTKLAVEKIGSKRSKNVLILGIISGLFDFNLEIMEGLVRHKWQHKGELVVQKNLEALRFGLNYVKENLNITLALKIPKLDKEPTMVLSGNDAISLGAIMAGLKYYGGYPITPASDIMEWLAEKLPALDGTVIQTEDEISALASVLGASYAGAKAMTATSGPGLSLIRAICISAMWISARKQ
jgi:2-oxoglutarate ferredoxin oxidoreductase subunit alpha